MPSDVGRSRAILPLLALAVLGVVARPGAARACDCRTPSLAEDVASHRLIVRTTDVFVEDASDGLWRRHWIEEARVENAPEMQRVVVALDPPVTATASSDACGIVVAGLGVDKRAYVLADRTLQGRTPEVWARAALGAYDEFEADRMVAEINQGGDLVISVLQQFRENFPVVKVRATRGKWVRAEPVAALYAEGRVAHVGRFDALEDQMCAFGADGTVKGRSPDRADALVWALSELLLGRQLRPSVTPL